MATLLLTRVGEQFLGRIRSEAGTGFRKLRWLGNELVLFVLDEYSGRIGVRSEAIFSALRARRSRNLYGIELEMPEGSSWGSLGDFGSFEAGADEWMQRRFERPFSADLVRERSRIGKKAKVLIEKYLGEAGRKFVKVDRSLSMTSTDLGEIVLHTYLSAGRDGLSYWQDIGYPDSRRALARESFSSMFGIGRATEFSGCAEKDPEAIAGFVAAETKAFVGMVEAALCER
ncbi:MAG: hypothetical protein AB7G12_01275 [Thermoanaerobaculia bacterium]